MKTHIEFHSLYNNLGFLKVTNKPLYNIFYDVIVMLIL